MPAPPRAGGRRAIPPGQGRGRLPSCAGPQPRGAPGRLRGRDGNGPRPGRPRHPGSRARSSASWVAARAPSTDAQPSATRQRFRPRSLASAAYWALRTRLFTIGRRSGAASISASCPRMHWRRRTKPSTGSTAMRLAASTADSSAPETSLLPLAGHGCAAGRAPCRGRMHSSPSATA